MNDELTIRALREAMAGESRGHHLDVATAAAQALAPRPEQRRQRRRDRLAIAAALVGAAAVAGVYAAVTSRPGNPAPAASSCGPVQTGALPQWARAGFTPPDLAVPHVVSADGRIVAVLFVELRVHQPAGTTNKILWTARDGAGAGPLVIRATLGATSVTRTVAGGPGPSTVDLPAPGCWHMALVWGRQHDTIAVPYAP